MRSEWITFWAPPLWHNPAPGASQAKIKEAEQKLGVQLPVKLAAMLTDQNGGPLRGRHEKSTQHHEIRGIDVGHFGIERNNPWWLDDEYWQPSGPLELLVPITGDGHNDLCLDYRSQGPTTEPGVTLVQCDAERESWIAASFDEFLGQIEPTEVGFVLTNASLAADEIAKRLARVCRSTPQEIGGRNPTWLVNSGRGSFQVSENRLPLDGDWYQIPEQPEDGLALVLRAENSLDQMMTDLHTVAEDANLL